MMFTRKLVQVRRASAAYFVAGSLFAVLGCGGEDAPPQTAASSEPSSGVTKPVASTHADIAVAESVRARCNFPDSPGEAPQFDFDAADLRARGENILDRVAQCMGNGVLQGEHLTLVGHADPRGPSSYNRQLGLARAIVVRDYLRSRGVPASSLAVQSRGELDAKGTDSASWQLDRRVDIE